ncbi:MAG TPA: hypothetical protein VF766_12270 [Pyrinomonadaceae bacterium]
MKKQALKAITMLFSIIVLAFVTAIASNAQSLGLQLKANIPFDFVVGNKTLAAGQYTIVQLTTTSDAGLSIRSRDGNHKAIRLTKAVQASDKRRKTTLTFRRYGETYYLAQVWMAGSSEGREIIKSTAERSADRELAQNSRPEIVTIVADVE